jgi:hypothetical protein
MGKKGARTYHLVPSGNNEAEQERKENKSARKSLESAQSETYVCKDPGEHISVPPVQPRSTKQRQPSGPSRCGCVRIEP